MVFTAQSGTESQWGTLGLFYLFIIFFKTGALALRFPCFLISFSILFASDAWLRYPDRGFASRMFLQIKGT